MPLPPPRTCNITPSNPALLAFNSPTMVNQTLKSYLPWTSSPLICNAPMAGWAGPNLATAVSLSGGLGFIGGYLSMPDLHAHMTTASATLKSSPNPTIRSSKNLPIGVGFLTFLVKMEEALPIIAEFNPIVVWLYVAQEPDDYKTWADAVRRVSPGTRIWIQTGSVAAAVHIAKTVAPDALCMQGADAGGHGFEHSAGVISLLPETVDAFAREGLAHIPLLAAGGIVDGRGVGAALVLGAAGIVMGTRFLASHEVTVHPVYQAAILEAKDGGQVTKRSKLWDQLHGPNIWPKVYDGRSLMMKSWKEYSEGVSLEEIQKRHKEAVESEDKGFAVGLEGRAAIWAGSGVGLVGEVEHAGEIVGKVRTEAKKALGRASKL